jgi:hypothetical protein
MELGKHEHHPFPVGSCERLEKLVNQQEYSVHDLICKSWEENRAPAIQDIRYAHIIPQVLLHVFSGQPFLIHIE